MTAGEPIAVRLRGDVTVRLRGDIVVRRIDSGKFADWVVKDPLTRRFFYFSDAEFCILKLLDGKRTLADLAAEVSRRQAPHFIDPQWLARFLADAKSKGLLVGGAPSRADDAGDPEALARRGGQRPERWWRQPLAIRFPGIHPDRQLDRVITWARTSGMTSWMSPYGVAAFVVVLWVVAGGVAIASGPAIAARLTELATAPAPRLVIAIMLLIGVIKVLHELAHAVVCKWLGGECREIGVMLLFGIPCLYCDVSDAWMIPRRGERMLVSAAGMIAEMCVAAVAALLWVAMTPGPWRDAALFVMVIGSVNTLLVNGNPLLRYDGYFILSDFMGVPNLGAEAIAATRRRVRRMLWGHDDDASPASEPNGLPVSQWWLIGYSIASTIYRYVMLGAVCYAIYRATAGNGLAWLAIIAAVVIFGRGQATWWRQVLRIPADDGSGSPPSRVRGMAIRAGLLGAFAILWLTPFSRSVVVPFSIRPAGHEELFTTVAGRIVEAAEDGTAVRRGDAVLVLQNETLVRESVAIETEHQVLSTKLQALQLRRASRPEVSAQIPAITAAIDAVAQRLRWHRERLQRLTISAPTDGVVYAPPRRQADPQNGPGGDVESGWTQWWTGTPLDSANRHATILEGTPVAWVGHARRREAVLVVPQSDVAAVRRGQRVELLRGDFGDTRVTGTVSEIASMAAGSGSPVGDASDRDYQAICEIDPTELALPVRSTGYAKIEVAPMSLHGRVVRFLRQAFEVP